MLPVGPPGFDLGPMDYESKKPLLYAISCNPMHSNLLIRNKIHWITLHAIAPDTLVRCDIQ